MTTASQGTGGVLLPSTAEGSSDQKTRRPPSPKVGPRSSGQSAGSQPVRRGDVVVLVACGQVVETRAPTTRPRGRTYPETSFHEESDSSLHRFQVKGYQRANAGLCPNDPRDAWSPPGRQPQEDYNTKKPDRESRGPTRRSTARSASPMQLPAVGNIAREPIMGSTACKKDVAIRGDGADSLPTRAGEGHGWGPR